MLISAGVELPLKYHSYDQNWIFKAVAGQWQAFSGHECYPGGPQIICAASFCYGLYVWMLTNHLRQKVTQGSCDYPKKECNTEDYGCTNLPPRTPSNNWCRTVKGFVILFETGSSDSQGQEHSYRRCSTNSQVLTWKGWEKGLRVKANK